MRASITQFSIFTNTCSRLNENEIIDRHAAAADENSLNKFSHCVSIVDRLIERVSAATENSHTNLKFRLVEIARRENFREFEFLVVCKLCKLQIE